VGAEGDARVSYNSGKAILLCFVDVLVHAPRLQKMRDGEIDHLNTMNRLVAERRARPTAVMPLAELGGFLLGVSTALLGKEAAMACTVAVETVIGDHYNDQIRQLLKAGYSEADLAMVFKRHRDEELEHLDIAKVNDAERAPLYNAFSQVIQMGCQAAIWVAKRV
jgi:ubiquinone biosynthesis monooxygenase Coq7